LQKEKCGTRVNIAAKITLFLLLICDDNSRKPEEIMHSSSGVLTFQQDADGEFE